MEAPESGENRAMLLEEYQELAAPKRFLSLFSDESMDEFKRSGYPSMEKWIESKIKRREELRGILGEDAQRIDEELKRKKKPTLMSLLAEELKEKKREGAE